MLKKDDIHIGKLLRFDIHTNVRHESYIGIVTYVDLDGFYVQFHDGDKLYAWYKYDLGRYKALEIK